MDPWRLAGVLLVCAIAALMFAIGTTPMLDSTAWEMFSKAADLVAGLFFAGLIVAFVWAWFAMFGAAKDLLRPR